MITGVHVRAARAAVKWSRDRLSDESDVARGTIQRMEKDDGEVVAHTDSVKKIVHTFERVGIEFIYGSAPGIRRHYRRRMT